MGKRLLSLLIAAALICGALGVSMTAYADNVDIGETSSGYEMLNVPQIRITTEEGNGTTLQKDDGYVNASVVITDTDGSTLEDSVQFKVRGNTTAMLTVQKKAYTFKFSKKKDVLGLGSGKKWALLANAFDPTLLRNSIAFDIANELSLDYTSNQEFVELWVDGSYRGCYGIYEPVQEGKDRVDIDIKSNNGMKDFLIEYEADRVEEDVTYFTVDGLRFILSEPEEPTEEQLDYVVSTMTDIINTLKGGSKDKIAEKIDVDSFVKFYLLNEYVKTFDFDKSSVFFYYKDGKLYAGPAWDYDLSAGNSNDALTNKRYKEAVPTTGLFCDKKNIYRYLCYNRWFTDAVKSVYLEHHDYFSDIYADGGLMDRLYQEYAEVFARNYSPGTWSVTKWWINIQKKPLATYQENYDYLKNWYRERNTWLSGYFENKSDVVILGDVDSDGNVTIVDATAVQRRLVDILPSSYNVNAADADGDGEISILDATAIQRWLAALPSNENIGKPIA